EAPKPDAASDAERAKAKVDKALAELTGDRSFADVAASFSEEPGADKNGGDFGWKLFSDLEAKSRRAISELDKGEHSSAVETEDSFQIFFVEDRQEKHAKPFTEVREQIKHDLQRADAPEYAQAAAQEFLAAWEEKNRTESTSLQAFAASRGITVFSADKPLARGQGSGTITPALVEKVIPLAQGDRDVIQVNDVAYAVEVIQVKDSYIPELDEVREQVENSYRREQARKLAKETAEKALAELNEVKNPEAVAAKFSAKVEATEQATRTSANGAIFNAPDAKTMLFTLSELSPILQQVVDAGSTFYVAQLTSVALPDDRDFEKTKDELHRRESQKNANRILDVLLKTLRAQSDVHVNPDLLNRKGQL
ncbi:MAG TPA: peptidyl-prolyl cis-trans isomerase, partial [Oligoflexia bacterium]|nr:peptidyl-prolyl cis-trans isomerase [Oligoflexia bacterium]